MPRVSPISYERPMPIQDDDQESGPNDDSSALSRLKLVSAGTLEDFIEQRAVHFLRGFSIDVVGTGEQALLREPPHVGQ